MSQPASLLDRLATEADLCRNEGAEDIAGLLDEAVAALRSTLVGFVHAGDLAQMQKFGGGCLLWSDQTEDGYVPVYSAGKDGRDV